jgi:hypothetical protein
MINLGDKMGESMKDNPKHNAKWWLSKGVKQRAVILLLILLFVYFSIWKIYINTTFRPIYRGIGASTINRAVSQYDDGYMYGLNRPSTFDFSGWIYIDPTIVVGDSLDTTKQFGLSIYPRGFDEYRIFVHVIYPSEESKPNHYIQKTDYISLDENMQPAYWDDITWIPIDPEENQKMYEMYYEDIKMMYQLAYEKWGILEP